MFDNLNRFPSLTELPPDTRVGMIPHARGCDGVQDVNVIRAKRDCWLFICDLKTNGDYKHAKYNTNRKESSNTHIGRAQ